MTKMFKTLKRPGLFRLMLALLVFIDHATRLNLGTTAVYVFFALSGYWICTMWNQRYSKASSPYVVYLFSRTMRLLPVFIVCSVVSWTQLIYCKQVPADLNWFHQAFSNLLILGYSGLSFRPDGPAWSLDIEMQFYIVGPLLIALMTKSPWTLIACAAISICGYFANITSTLPPFLGFFALGVASATVGWKPDDRVAWASLLVTIVVIAICIVGPLSGVLLGGAHRGPLYAFNGAAEATLAFLLIPWAIYTTRQRSTDRDRMCGDLSYIIYLLHWPVLRAVLAPGSSSMIHRAGNIGVAFLIVAIGSFALWRTVDHPFNMLRSRWVDSKVADENRMAAGIAL